MKSNKELDKRVDKNLKYIFDIRKDLHWIFTYLLKESKGGNKELTRKLNKLDEGLKCSN